MMKRARHGGDRIGARCRGRHGLAISVQPADEQGQVLIWLLILLPLLLLMAGILIEGGLMFRSYRLAQMTADAAAHAAAQELDTARYLRTGRIALTPEAGAVAQRIAAANIRGQIRCGQPQVWANRVDVLCEAHLRPVVLARTQMVRVAVRGRARPAWGIAAEHE
jgi:Flp pilus assembly protein TadG